MSEHVIRFGLVRDYYWTLYERSGAAADLLTNTPVVKLFLRKKNRDGSSDPNATPLTRTLTGQASGVAKFTTVASTITGAVPNQVVSIGDFVDLHRGSLWDMWITATPAPNGSTGVYPDLDYDTARVTT